MEFKILIVVGWDRDGAPHMDITLSKQLAMGLSKQLKESRIVEIDNLNLWEPMMRNEKPAKTHSNTTP